MTKKNYLVLMATNMNTIREEVPLVYVEYTHMSLKQRLHFHLYHSQLEEPKEPFHKVLKYVGTQCFKWEVLQETPDLDEAQDLVRHYQREYQSDVIGYNRKVYEQFAGRNNGRYGDHRTWEELHGKERAEELRQIQIRNFTDHPSLSEHMRRRLEVWNPMDDPVAREKVRQGKIGTKNPAALWDYYLTLEDGTEIKFECLREFCRRNKDIKKNMILWALRKGKKYKNMTVRKELKNGKNVTNNQKSS